jgi:DNA-binding transcriptional LysR family regulator
MSEKSPPSLDTEPSNHARTDRSLPAAAGGVKAGLQHGLSARDFDLLTLKLFLAVADEGNMMRAAEREHITASAISRRIAALESRAGFKLLDRNDRGVTPTSAGMALIDGAKRAFDALENLAFELNAHRRGTSGFVRLHAHMSAMTSRLMRAIAAFRKISPGIEILIEERTSTEVIDALNSSGADLGLISGTVDATGLNVLPWIRDELLAVVPTEHALASNGRLSMKELLCYPFIAMQRGSALLALFERAAQRIGQPLLPCAYLVNFESVRLMVEANLGVAILPKASATGRGIVALPLVESWSIREINLCFRDRPRLSPAAQKLLDYLTSEVARIQPSGG